MYRGMTIFSIPVKWQPYTGCCISDPASTSLPHVPLCVFYLSAAQRNGEQEDRDFLYGGEEDSG